MAIITDRSKSRFFSKMSEEEKEQQAQEYDAITRFANEQMMQESFKKK